MTKRLKQTLIRSDLKIDREAAQYRKSGKLRSLLILIDLYCGSLSKFIDLIVLFQNQKLWNFDIYQAIEGQHHAIGDGHASVHKVDH